MKKIFLEGLPRINLNSKRINWSEAIKYKIKFIYDDIEGYIEIVSYEKKRQLLSVKYNDKISKIATNHLMACEIGKIVGKRTIEFKIENGTIFQDNKRDITITDRKYRKEKDGHNKKWYRYTCNKCGWTEGWIVESDLIHGQGCACCCIPSKTPVLGINTIWDTDPWMIPIINDDEFCKTHTYGSRASIFPTCPDCGRIKNKKMLVCTIYKYHSMNCFCSDGVHYPEKLMFNVLEQLNMKFDYHKDFQWSKNIQVDNIKLNRREYDFCFELNNEKYIVETHGIQHYEENTNFKLNLDNVKKNDKFKKELALSNGIKPENYIVIDCRYSELEWIKQNILSSRLNELFDLSRINWSKCGEFALSNLVKIACEHKKNNPELTTVDIGKIMNLSYVTIQRYLKKGSSNELKWCNYNPKEEQRKNGKLFGKSVGIFKDGILLETFSSVRELERRSEQLFGTKLNKDSIGKICKGMQKEHRGYTFKYI